MDLNLQGKTAVVTGAGGAICGEIAAALAGEGCRIAVWDLSREAAESTAQRIRKAGGQALAVACDAGDRAQVAAALEKTLEAFATVDLLVNGAGGSRRETTTSDTLAFFDIAAEDMLAVIGLNYMTAVVPCQAVGRLFAEKQAGAVVNITSIAGLAPLTRAIAYSNAKAALNSFTQWLAVHMAQTYSPAIRVNAVAPGFVLTGQNRFLLVDERTGQATERGKTIIARVPMGRYGEPEEIAGAVLWLLSERARFVTGAVLPVDGGFSAFSGV